MKVLSLFAGIGGFDLGLELAGFETVAQVEIDDYCNKILEYQFPQVKRYRDIKEVTGEQVTKDCGAINLICGGFPCQDLSYAGKSAGLEGEKSGLWWEMHRLIGELKPDWVIAENVDALRNRGLNRVHASLEKLGYQVWCFGIPAGALGAPHQRKRLWIVGHSQSERQRKPNNKANAGATGGQTRCIPGGAGSLVDPESVGSGAGGVPGRSKPSAASPANSSGNVVNPNSDGAQEGAIARNDQQEIPTACDTSAMAHADSNGVWEQSGWRSRTDWSTYSPFNFPVGPGQQQHEWEEPRTVESQMGVTADGLPRKLALRACGNALLPATAFIIGRAILRLDRIM